MIPELRPYQTDLVNGVRAARLDGKRIIVVQAPTGAGKTNVMAHIVKSALEKGSPTLCMVHRRRLVDQISDRLRQFEVPHGVLMRGDIYDRNKFVQVASRDTVTSRCLNNEWVGMPPARLVIVDEGRHAASPDSEYRRVLEHYPDATVLLFDATPVGPDGQGLGPWAQALVCCAPTSQLIRDGHLCPVRVYAPERKKKGRKFLKGIAGDLVESWQQYAENRPTVLFCSRVQHSLDAVEAFNNEGIAAVHVDADTPDDERDRAFNAVATERIKVLSNVGIIGEGVDVPELTCCQFYCEVGGRVRWMQGVGRVMRPAEGKSYGIVIDHSGAVFRHGFPDEDTPWTLNGNADVDYKAKHDDPNADKTFYCRWCEIAYRGQEQCPQCGRMPAPPPRSIFAPDPVRSTSEILTEADRNGGREHSRDEKIAHWFRCLSIARKRNGTFAMASVIFRQKYGHWPHDDFPMMSNRRREKVRVLFPDFMRSRV
jgi:superfamily II DNA or RNA helicase